MTSKKELTGIDRRLYERATPGAKLAVDYLIETAQLILQKNEAYGDSALRPMRVFSRSSAEEQILVRLDDKLSRIARGSEEAKLNVPEDTARDIVGYLALLHAARKLP